MTEGVFPKAHGDVLYASEVNKFNNINDIPITSDTTFSSTTSTGWTTVKTITIGGGFTGYKLITIAGFAREANGLGVSDILSYQFLNNNNEVVRDVDASFVVSNGNPALEVQFLAKSFLVSNGDSIEVQIKTLGGHECGISKLYIYSGGFGLTATIA